MPLMPGQQQDHGFDQPIKLMSDCHRRIEKFLGVLFRVLEERKGRPLEGQYREAVEAALRYFRNAAPWHTQDEERSLFPRMRKLDDPTVRQALQRIDALESDHDQVDRWHQAAHSLFDHWLATGMLTDQQTGELSRLLTDMQQTYQQHIAQEDDVIFPLAQQTLSPAAITAIGREMAERRGVDPQLPPRRCRHGQHHTGQTSVHPGATGAQGA